MTKQSLPALIAVAQAAGESPQLAALMERATPDEQKAFLTALRSAYDAGQESAEQRTGRFVARVVCPMLGLEAGIDNGENGDAQPSVRRLRSIVRLLAGIAGGPAKAKNT